MFLQKGNQGSHYDTLVFLLIIQFLIKPSSLSIKPDHQSCPSSLPIKSNHQMDRPSKTLITRVLLGGHFLFLKFYNLRYIEW